LITLYRVIWYSPILKFSLSFGNSDAEAVAPDDLPFEGRTGVDKSSNSPGFVGTILLPRISILTQTSLQSAIL
ncbi:MAG: hypothetical protein WCN27_01795, partial [Alphaproteobacteria bacterium]